MFNYNYTVGSQVNKNAVIAGLASELNHWIAERIDYLENKNSYQQINALVRARVGVKYGLASTILTGVNKVLATAGSGDTAPIKLATGVVGDIITLGTSIADYVKTLKANTLERQQLEYALENIRFLQLLQDFSRALTPTTTGQPGPSHGSAVVKLGISEKPASEPSTDVKDIRDPCAKIIYLVAELLYYRHIFLFECDEFDADARFKFIQFLSKVIKAKLLDSGNILGIPMSRFLRAAFPSDPKDPIFFGKHRYYKSIHSLGNTFYLAEIFYKADRIRFVTPDSIQSYNSPYYKSQFSNAPGNYPPTIDFDPDPTDLIPETLPHGGKYQPYQSDLLQQTSPIFAVLNKNFVSIRDALCAPGIYLTRTCITHDLDTLSMDLKEKEKVLAELEKVSRTIIQSRVAQDVASSLNGLGISIAGTSALSTLLARFLSSLSTTSAPPPSLPTSTIVSSSVSETTSQAVTNEVVSGPSNSSSSANNLVIPVVTFWHARCDLHDMPWIAEQQRTKSEAELSLQKSEHSKHHANDQSPLGGRVTPVLPH